MLEGILLPSNMAAKTTFCLHLVKLLIVTFRCAVNVTTSFFSTFSLKFKVSVKENEVPTEKNSSCASIFATKVSYISN